MEQIDKRELENQIYSFMKEMNIWEVETEQKYSEVGIEDYGVEAGKKLKSIYDAYLTVKDRHLGRLPIPNAGFPPEYDLNCEKITNVTVLSSKKVKVETIWTHPVVEESKIKYRYIMINSNGKWLLDSKKMYSSVTQKWKGITF
ncbi:NTF2 fold immunity protein [Xylocopilactobacillus apis]|uniref:NTF2 fold immunity protein domain-containing protein n=1 Tax=Xylocopilactobacillus apis TaxID=2932183 RepID=A0AAU9DJV5_9LACO|nr:NTF2 fold immunity protein [Xylocopilactobacillus apis]BDR55714.1 hypothetical protein KIMC2_02760 [Xylocopilactobacillus apis]